MATTDRVEFVKSENGWGVKLLAPPVPASRPRVTRWGTYYTKRYTDWKQFAERELAKYTTEDLYEGPVTVEIVVAGRRPATTKRMFPVGDVDNYAKAPLDAITKSKCLWKDDDQVVALEITKQYAPEGTDPGFYIRVGKVMP